MINTLEDYKKYLGITQTSLDTWIGSQITEIEDEVKNYLNRDIESADVTDVLHGDNSSEIILTQFPITAIKNIYYFDDPDWVEYIEGTDYDRYFVDYSKLILVNGYFPYGVGNIKVVYAAGYTTVPGCIKQGLKELLALRFKDSFVSDGRLGFLSKNKTAGASSSDNFDRDAEKKIFAKMQYYRNINI